MQMNVMMPTKSKVSRNQTLSVALAAAVMLALAFVACASESVAPTNAPTVAPADTPTAAPSQDEGAEASAADTDPLAEPEPQWRVYTDSEELDIILATPDLAPGVRRFAVVITDNSGVVPLPFVKLTAYQYEGTVDAPGERSEPTETVTSSFQPFPYGGRGIHVATINFTEAGTWGVEARLPRATGDIEFVEVVLPVADHTESVDIGQVPPDAPNRTLADVDDIAELTTGTMHNPTLYQTAIPDALTNGKPTVVVFASPAFCTNAVCGPQVEVLSNLSDQFGAQADYIHVDLFENPQEIQGDLSRARLTPLLDAWGLVSQEWTFVMDASGEITGRFENFAPEPELVDALNSVLGSS